jgi:hypothetical protein
MRWFTFQTYKPKKRKCNEKPRITRKKTKNTNTLSKSKSKSKSKAFPFALCNRKMFPSCTTKNNGAIIYINKHKREIKTQQS